MLNLAPQHDDLGIYLPRNPQAGSYFRCVQDHFEQLEMHWPDRYASRYGFWRPYVTDVIYRYLECGDLHFGFSRVKCQDCGHEYLLAYSCKRRHFCPSCHQKRVVEFGVSKAQEVIRAEFDFTDTHLVKNNNIKIAALYALVKIDCESNYDIIQKMLDPKHNPDRWDRVYIDGIESTPQGCCNPANQN